TGPAPYVMVGWHGPVAAPTRTIDVGPLTTGLAAIVLKRELDRIEAFEAAAHEALRRRNRLEMDRERARAAAEAARRVEEEARQARLREQAPEPPPPPVPQNRPLQIAPGG
ncbi:MAG TPA: hypothetical protein VM434_13945, partial [Beijerinckiaceae bacterium]|nr:hypothetical protein [Beijerinckiaceae bacterium]